MENLTYDQREALVNTITRGGWLDCPATESTESDDAVHADAWREVLLAEIANWPSEPSA